MQGEGLAQDRTSKFTTAWAKLEHVVLHVTHQTQKATCVALRPQAGPARVQRALKTLVCHVARASTKALPAEAPWGVDGTDEQAAEPRQAASAPSLSPASPAPPSERQATALGALCPSQAAGALFPRRTFRKQTGKPHRGWDKN